MVLRNYRQRWFPRYGDNELPLNLRFANDMSEQVLSGKKYLALAITEAFAGSDVSGLQTTAVRDGDYWIVTGTKK